MQEIKYQGKRLKVTEEVIGNHTYERTHLMPGVHILPIKDNKVLLMHEYRAHENGSRWKLVTGWCDKKGLSPLDHAKEELAEEVGMQAEYWEEIYDNSSDTMTVNTNIHYFCCRDISKLLIPVENPDIDQEVYGYDWFSFDEIFSLLNKGKMRLTHSAMVVVWYLYNLEKEKQS